MVSKNTRTRLINRNGKKVRTHRWLFEQHIGRKLLPSEQVHHINGNPLDNHIKNLEILDVKTHMCLHKQKYPDIKVCCVCGNEFIVNPRKRKRNKCCSFECAQSMRMTGLRKFNVRNSLQKLSKKKRQM